MNRWCIGIDFGQRNDRTALAAVEVVYADPRPSFLDVRYLERLPLNTPYPDQCARIAALIASVPELNRADVIVDASGVGVAVADTLREFLPRGFDELSITAGHQSWRRGREVSVPKRDLVSQLAVAMQTRRLRLAEGLSEGPALLAELGAFGVNISEAGHDSYGARTGHDDLVLAVSYAVWKVAKPGMGGAFLEHYRRERAGRPTIISVSRPDPAPHDPLDDLDPVARARTEALRRTLPRRWGR